MGVRGMEAQGDGEQGDRGMGEGGREGRGAYGSGDRKRRFIFYSTLRLHFEESSET